MKNRLLFALLILLLGSASFAGPHIQLKHSNFDPLTATLSKQTKSDAAQDGKRYYIIQFQGPIEDSWKAEATAAGAELFDYIPDFAFIARAEPASVEKLRSLSSVRWVGDYSPEYRLSPKLPKSGKVDVFIRVFPGVDKSPVKKRIVADGGKVSSADDDGQTIIASIPAVALLHSARTAGVEWIEPVAKIHLMNSKSREIMNVASAWTNVGLYGAGQIVAIADTGLDTGNAKKQAPLSADFSGRVVKTYCIGRNVWSDDYGHGTHVAGSVAGSGALSGSNPTLHQYANSYAGVAPEASIVFESLLSGFDYSTNPPTPSLSVPNPLTSLFTTPYTADGARVHTNSWGDSVYGTYSSHSQSIDNATWSYKDLVVLFSAGNDGVDSDSNGLIDLGQISSQGSAKNCITVGATESEQSTGGLTSYWGSYWPGDYPTNPIKTDYLSNNRNGMAAFSSRGPCDDGRIKPDICAPGTNIISSRSHNTYALSTFQLWGVRSDNTDYLYCGGTSMSTPLVAGACVLTREYYVDKGVSPSAALIKATLLNGAFDMTPGQYTSPQEIPARPNNVEGWGRLDLKNSLIPASPKKIYYLDSSSGLSTGGSYTCRYYNVSSATPFRITLVWTDYPASTTASKALVNDLDLTVIAPNGTYNGNSVLDGDRLNNVEGVDITGAVGMYTIKVTGYNVTQGPQPYALVISGALLPSQPTNAATATEAKALPDNSYVVLQGKIVSAGNDQLNNFFYIQEPNRSSGIRVQYDSNGGPTVTEGMTVSVAGTLTTIAGERVIKDAIVY